MEKNQASSIKEFTLKINKKSNVKYQLLKFNKNINIAVEKWSSKHTKLTKEVKGDRRTVEKNNKPKFEAESKFGHEARQNAKKRRYESNNQLPETTSWNLDVKGKKFKGARQGGIADNSSYYLFSRGEGDVINAHKLEEWYNFQPVLRYKTLTFSEAEEEFARRNKVLNKFNIMIQKRLNNEEDKEIDECENKNKSGEKKFKTNEFKISEMDEWSDSNEDTSNSTDEEKDKEKIKIKQKQKRKVKAKPKSKSKRSDESATEDSDNGDEEGRELDYISDSSEDVSDAEAKVTKEMQGVSDEKALKSLLGSDNDSDKDEENKTTEKKLKDDTDSDNSDMDNVSVKIMTVNSDEMKKNSDDPIVSFLNNSSDQSLDPLQKNAVEEFSPVTMSDTHGITEEAVRRYLLRKPFTSAQLINKFRNRSNLSLEQLVKIIGLILKKINPKKQIIQNKMYLILNE